MVGKPDRYPAFVLAAAFLLAAAGQVVGQPPAVIKPGATPRVVISTGARHAARGPASPPAARILYPWKTHITATIFWIGEKPTPRNPTPNHKSSWDTAWAINFGGYDDPDPANRIADHTTGEFRPKGFVPKLNPFYIALPYNDVLNYRMHKSEAARVVPWFSRHDPIPGKTVCKGKWIQIYNGSRSCYGQWEDCGPWVTDDWEYVFGAKPPKATQNGAAGIDISPSIRDYLQLRSGQKVHWRFVEESQVPHGPWKRYGASPAEEMVDAAAEAEEQYLEYLRQLRDASYRKKLRQAPN